MKDVTGSGPVIDGELVGENLPTLNDEELKGTISDLKKSYKRLELVSDVLKNHLGLNEGRNKVKSFTARALNFVLPKSLQEYLPAGMVKFMAEEFDALELLETLMRDNINDSQGALKKLAAVAIQKQRALEQLEADIQKAEKGEWNAQKLQDYVANLAGFKVDPAIKTLLATDFKGMSDEAKEARKQDLIFQLKANVELGKQLVKTLEKACSAGLGVFQQGLSQYSAYTGVYRQIAAIRDAAKTFAKMDGSMYAARDALTETFKVSLHTLAIAVDAATHVERYAIASPEMRQLFLAGQQHLETKLLTLQEERTQTRKALTDQSKKTDEPKE